MTRYPIYRTEKGNLTLKKQGEPVYVVKAKTEQGAKEMLAHLKQIEKNQE